MVDSNEQPPLDDAASVRFELRCGLSGKLPTINTSYLIDIRVFLARQRKNPLSFTEKALVSASRLSRGKDPIFEVFGWLTVPLFVEAFRSHSQVRPQHHEPSSYTRRLLSVL
jgi:hypothetical protein